MDVAQTDRPTDRLSGRGVQTRRAMIRFDAVGPQDKATHWNPMFCKVPQVDVPVSLPTTSPGEK